VVGGHVGIGVLSLPTSLAYITSGQLRALGVSDVRRAPQLPDVPALGESLLPGFAMPTWYALWVPTGTPTDIVDKLHAVVSDALKQEDVRQRVIGIGFTPGGAPRAEFTNYVKAEFDTYANLITQIGLKKKPQ